MLYISSNIKNEDIIDYFKSTLLSNVKSNDFMLNELCSFGNIKLELYSEDLDDGIYFFQKTLCLNILPYFYVCDIKHNIYVLIFIINKKHTTYIVYKHRNLIKDIEITEEQLINYLQYILKIF